MLKFVEKTVNLNQDCAQTPFTKTERDHVILSQSVIKKLNRYGHKNNNNDCLGFFQDGHTRCQKQQCQKLSCRYHIKDKEMCCPRCAINSAEVNTKAHLLVNFAPFGNDERGNKCVTKSAVIKMTRFVRAGDSDGC